VRAPKIWRSRRLRYMERDGFARGDASGPYWMGERFTLVDVTFVPWFEQLAG
jgi:glutathione S-transferase